MTEKIVEKKSKMFTKPKTEPPTPGPTVEEELPEIGLVVCTNCGQSCEFLVFQIDGVAYLKCGLCGYVSSVLDELTEGESADG